METPNRWLPVKYLVTRGYFLGVAFFIYSFKKENPSLQANNSFGWMLDFYFLLSALMPLISLIMRIICFPLWYLLLVEIPPEM